MAWHMCRWQDRPVILREKEGGGRRARLDSVCDCLHQTLVHFSREKSSTFRKLQRRWRCLDIQRCSLVFCQIAEQLLPQGAFMQDVACAALAAGFSILFEWAAEDRAKSADFSKVLVGVECVKCSAETLFLLSRLQCEETWRAQEQSYVRSGRVRSLRHSRPFASLRGTFSSEEIFWWEDYFELKARFSYFCSLFWTRWSSFTWSPSTNKIIFIYLKLGLWDTD